jgi:hypothetical protein
MPFRCFIFTGKSPSMVSFSLIISQVTLREDFREADHKFRSRTVRKFRCGAFPIDLWSCYFFSHCQTPADWAKNRAAHWLHQKWLHWELQDFPTDPGRSSEIPSCCIICRWSAELSRLMLSRFCCENCAEAREEMNTPIKMKNPGFIII